MDYQATSVCSMPSLCPSPIMHLDGSLQGWCGRTQCKWLRERLPVEMRLLKETFLVGCSPFSFLPEQTSAGPFRLSNPVQQGVATPPCSSPTTAGERASYGELAWRPGDQIFTVGGRSWS